MTLDVFRTFGVDFRSRKHKMKFAFTLKVFVLLLVFMSFVANKKLTISEFVKQ